MDKLQAVFFDLDGTLVNTLSDIANAYNYALAQVGLPARTESDYKQFIGNGSKVLCERLCGEHTDKVDEVNAIAVARYLEYCTEISDAYTGVQDAIEVLHSRGIKIAVLSNKPDALTKEIIGTYFYKSMFAHIRGLKDGEEPKPDTTVLLSMCEDMEVDPRECIFLGDSETDVHTAKNCNMKSVAVDWGYRSVAQLEEAGADIILEDTADIASLPEIFENIE